MSTIPKLKSLKSEVKYLLQLKQKYRDNDALLVAGFYWHRQSQSLLTLSASEFLELLINGALPFPDTITRLRRKIQQQNPELRGENYYKRKALESEIREGIHAL